MCIRDSSKGITAVFSIQHEPVAFSEAKEHSYEYLRRTAENVIRLFFSAKKQNWLAAGFCILQIRYVKIMENDIYFKVDVDK